MSRQEAIEAAPAATTERDEAADAAARAARDARLDRDAPGLRDEIGRLMRTFPGTTGRGMRITIGGEVVWPPRKEV